MRNVSQTPPEPTTAPERSAEKATNKSSAARPESIHAGHRKRMRERFLRGSMDDLAPHELLELILGYAAPRIDVNPLAHRLINRFGSLSGVMEASPEELMAEEGMGECATCLLRLFPAVTRRCAMDQTEKITVFDTVDKLVTFLRPRFTGVTVEQVYLILLDNGMHMIGSHVVAAGSVNCSAVTVRHIAELCLFSHASAAVLAHNHPKGMAVPSGADIEVTQQIESALSLLGVPLLEHLVITEFSFAPILRPKRGMRRISPVTGRVDAGFYRNFYGAGEQEMM